MILGFSEIAEGSSFGLEKSAENSAQVHLERGKFQKTNNRLLVRAFTVQPSTPQLVYRSSRR